VTQTEQRDAIHSSASEWLQLKTKWGLCFSVFSEFGLFLVE